MTLNNSSKKESFEPFRRPEVQKPVVVFPLQEYYMFIVENLGK